MDGERIITNKKKRRHYSLARRSSLLLSSVDYDCCDCLLLAPLLFVGHSTALSHDGCSRTPRPASLMRGRSPASHPTIPSSFALLQIPPLRYELVETDLHRGGYPTLRNFPFLARLHLRTLISLTPEPPTADLTLLCAHYHITLHHYAVPYPADSLSVPAATVAATLSIILSRTALPAYVHCLDGRSVTSGVVAVLRRLQHWRMESCVAEYERMCGVGAGDAVRDMLTEWSEPIRLNSQLLPAWLWDGKWCGQHPTMPVLDDSEPWRETDTVEATDTTSAAAVTASEKKKVKSSSTSTQSATADSDTTAAAAAAAANSTDDPNAALLARWNKRRSWLYCDTLLSSQPLTVPEDDEPLYSVDRRMAGWSAYLDSLMLEGFTITNTFPRPLQLLHVVPTSGGTAASSGGHTSSTEQLHGAHSHT